MKVPVFTEVIIPAPRVIPAKAGISKTENFASESIIPTGNRFVAGGLGNAGDFTEKAGAVGVFTQHLLVLINDFIILVFKKNLYRAVRHIAGAAVKFQFAGVSAAVFTAKYALNLSGKYESGSHGLII